jgi:hypothetical protein
MAEDLDDTLDKFPVLSTTADDVPDVKRGEVFCSKIIHQKATHQSRFTMSQLYAKIMVFNYPEWSPEWKRPWPRPLKSPFPCFNCHMYFDDAPIFICIVRLDGTRTEYGNYCSMECGLAAIYAMNSYNLAVMVSDFIEYCQDYHGLQGDSVALAPHFSERQCYGGMLTDDEYKMVAKTRGLSTHERMEPFIPTEVVTEWQCKADEEDSACPASDVSSMGTLSRILGSKPEAATHHYRWEVHGLRQKPLDQIKARLQALPKPEKKQGLYELYYERHKADALGASESKSGAETSSAATAASASAMPPPPKKRTRVSGGAKASKASGSRKSSSENNALGGMLVPA